MNDVTLYFFYALKTVANEQCIMTSLAVLDKIDVRLWVRGEREVNHLHNRHTEVLDSFVPFVCVAPACVVYKEDM